MLSYQTAWLKAHYPAEFMCSALSADMDNTDKIVTLIDECLRMQLTIRPPNVNSSDLSFTAMNTDTVQYGLGAIKGVGEAALTHLLEDRHKNGTYRDLFDFCARMDLSRVNKRVMEALVLSGGMDDLGPNRATLMERLPDALKAAEQHHHNRSAGQDDLFGGEQSAVLVDLQAPGDALPEWCDDVRLEAERETLGLYLTGHPIDQYLDELDRFTHGRLNRLCEKFESAANGRGRSRDIEVIAAGLIVDTRTRKTASGGKMGFITLDDRSTRLEVVLGPEQYEQYASLMINDTVVVVEGGMGRDDFKGGYRIRASAVIGLDSARVKFARRLDLEFDQRQAGHGFIDDLCAVLQPARGGNCPVIVHYSNEIAETRLHFGDAWRVTPGAQLLENLKELGDDFKCHLVY